MCLYALFIVLVKLAFCGNEHVAARSYLYIIVAIPAIALILITILNIKTYLI